MKKFILLLILAGCEPSVVSKSVLETGPEYYSSQSCSTLGYCMSCGLGINGSFDCGFGFKLNCPGIQDITARDSLVLYRYEDGTEKIFKQQIVTSAGVCE